MFSTWKDPRSRVATRIARAKAAHALRREVLIPSMVAGGMTSLAIVLIG